MDAPSAQLRNLLTDLQLVTPSQWRQCRSAVRAFVRDLPAFDSVWIDGLVQIGAITLFQADWISRGDGEQLAIGNYLLEKSAGRDELLFSCEGVNRKTRQKVRLTRVHVSGEEDRQRLQARFLELISKTEQAGTRSRIPLDLISDIHEVGPSLWLVSPLTEGVSAATLVIRRGRFPEDVVRGIAVQLIRRLAAAEEAGIPHGDLRPSHLLLTPSGRISLIHHGILAALVPEVTIHDTVPLEFIDGLAPERIRQPSPVTSRSEIYALGCLLWQLLTGRPPHLSADPLGKRAAHWKKQIPDVRELAPDVPEELASLIDQMTQRDENLRPGSIRELLDAVKTWGGTREHRIAGFVKSFETASTHPWWKTDFVRAPKVSPPRGNSLLATAATVALAVTAGVLARPYLGSLLVSEPQQRIEESAQTGTSQADINSGVTQASHVAEPLKETTPAILPMPIPSAEGVVQLEGGRVYRASEIQVSGPLSIQAPLTKPALILVQGSSWRIVSAALQLQGVEVRRLSSPADAAIIDLQAQILQIDSCRFTSKDAGGEALAAISWTVQNPEEGAAAQVSVKETGFLQCGTAIRMHAPLMGAMFENVVKTGAGSLLDLQSGVGPGYQVRLVTNRVTLCDSGPLVSMPIDSVSSSGKLIIEGQDSALAPAGESPLLLLEGSLLSKDWHQHLEIAASGIVLRQGSDLAGFRGTTGPSLARVVAPIDTGDLSVDGLLIGTFLFSGVNLTDPNDCIAIAENIPLHLAGSPIGATLDAFPVPDVPVIVPDGGLEITTQRIAPLPFPNYNSPEVR